MYMCVEGVGVQQSCATHSGISFNRFGFPVDSRENFFKYRPHFVMSHHMEEEDERTLQMERQEKC